MTQDLSRFHDIELQITVEFGRAELTIRDLLRLTKGGLIEMNKLSGEPLDLRVNGRLTARGEIVIVNDNYGIRVTEIVSPEGLNLTDKQNE